MQIKKNTPKRCSGAFFERNKKITIKEEIQEISELKVVAKNLQFKLEIKLYSFENRNTETSSLYIRDIYTMNQCFVTSVTEWLRGEGMSEKVRPRQNSLFSAKIKLKM